MTSLVLLTMVTVRQQVVSFTTLSPVALCDERSARSNEVHVYLAPTTNERRDARTGLPNNERSSAQAPRNSATNGYSEPTGKARRKRLATHHRDIDPARAASYGGTHYVAWRKRLASNTATNTTANLRDNALSSAQAPRKPPVVWSLRDKVLSSAQAPRNPATNEGREATGQAT